MGKNSEVQWEASYQSALDRSQKEKKPLLLDFFKDG